MHGIGFSTFDLTVPVWISWPGAAPISTMIALSRTFWSVGEDGQGLDAGSPAPPPTSSAK